MAIINQENSCHVLANKNYPVLFAYRCNGEMVVSTEKPEERNFFQLPNLTAENFGDAEFKKTYGLKYALYGGAMANGIASSDMVIALGKAGCMGSYGSGGMRLEIVEKEIDKMKTALGEKPFLVNMKPQPISFHLTLWSISASRASMNKTERSSFRIRSLPRSPVRRFWKSLFLLHQWKPFPPC